MRPWLEREYADIVNEYKSGGYGIYDDTEDLSRAIALSDMYYGDSSSVMKLFEAAGKPFLGQMIETMITSTINGFYDDGNYIWFMDSNNILYKHNKQNNKTEHVWMIPGQKAWANVGIAENKRKLYFVPLSSNEISVFDMEKKIFEQIYFKNDCNVINKFRAAISFKNFIYFIPIEYPAIMRLNTNTNEIEYFSQWAGSVSVLQISELQERDWKDVIFCGFCVVESEIAIVIHRANAVMFFNMETCSYKIKSIGEKNEEYATICFDGQNYYITSYYEKYIVKWNRQTDEILKIRFPHSFSRKKNKIGNFFIQYLNGNIWLFPASANNAYKINTNTYEITELPELTEHFENKDLDFYYLNFSCKKNSIYAPTLSKGIAEYNTDTRELNFIKSDIEFWLFVWLYNYDNWKNEYCKAIEATEFAGKKIWEFLKNFIKGEK
jgi:hypothetical protein